MKGYALLAAVLASALAWPTSTVFASNNFELESSGGTIIYPGQDNEKETEFRQVFPDENFRKYLKTLDITADNWEKKGEGNKLTGTKTINLSGYPSITDLTGIEQFTQLTTLTINGNTKLLDLNLSGNSVLKTVNCSQNKELRKISLPASVTDLTCNYNGNLFSLNLEGLSNLENLSCKNQNQNGLMSLTLPTSRKLRKIDCSGNGLTSIKNLTADSSVTELNCSNNRLTSLTVPNGLKSLNCANNQLKTLDLSEANGLQNPVVSPQTIPYLDESGKVNFANLVADYTSKVETISGVKEGDKLPYLTAADPVKGMITYKYRTKATNSSSDTEKKSDILMEVRLVRKDSASQPEQPTAPVNSIAMKRLYNPNSGEHFYTSNPEESSILISKGWEPEGTGWIAPASSSKPVYRLYNANAGDHHYTVDLNERDTLVTMGWKNEGIGWYSADNSGVPVYRQYNENAKASGAHNYTVDANEASYLVSNGWKEEGIAWYGVKN